MSFDPNAYLDLPIEEAFERRPLVPVSDYVATITDLQARQWTSKDKTDSQGRPKTGIAYDVSLELDIPLEVKEKVGLKPDFVLKLKDSIMVDLNENGGLDTAAGANRQLRNYREALDMNKAGVTFRPREMVGRRLLVKIKHEQYPEGSDNWNERANGVARLA